MIEFTTGSSLQQIRVFWGFHKYVGERMRKKIIYLVKNNLTKKEIQKIIKHTETFLMKRYRER